MLFNSISFAAFYGVIYLGYLLSQGRLRRQNLLLLVGSYYFYGCWDWRFLSLICVSTGVDYICGRLLDRGYPSEAADRQSAYWRRGSARKTILAISLISNLGILGFFKYCDFFTASAVSLLNTLGLGLEPRLLHIILPVGISFYTFQTLSYTIDIYLGRIRAECGLLNFAVFVAFFPQLVAGPILRASEFLPQVSQPRRLRLQQIYEGGYLILWGLFKKVVIADNLAFWVDRVFAQSPEQLYGGAVLVAVYAFAFQIYCDFSGYTDIARGCSRMMGFDIPLNFNLPYFSTNPVEFWRRWHISLSTWLRDYLYIPLGGNRRGPRRTCINLMLTMLLGGLWHGAAWTFVVWGLYQGLLLVTYKLLQPSLDRLRRSLSKNVIYVYRLGGGLLFFHLVCLGWLIFRAESLSQALQLAEAAAQPWLWWVIQGANTLEGTGLFQVLPFLIPLLVIQGFQYYKNDLNFILRRPAWVRALVYAVLIYGLLWYGVEDGKTFVYFQF